MFDKIEPVGFKKLEYQVRLTEPLAGFVAMESWKDIAIHKYEKAGLPPGVVLNTGGVVGPKRACPAPYFALRGQGCFVFLSDDPGVSQVPAPRFKGIDFPGSA